MALMGWSYSMDQSSYTNYSADQLGNIIEIEDWNKLYHKHHYYSDRQKLYPRIKGCPKGTEEPCVKTIRRISNPGPIIRVEQPKNKIPDAQNTIPYPPC